MKCPICGKQTLPGAKLCSPCRAALKRAKDDSVWEMPPGHGARPPSAAPMPDASGETRSILGSRLVGWRGAGVGAAALFVAAGVFATVRLVQVDAPEPARVEPVTAVAPVTPPTAAAAPSVSAPQVLALPPVAAPRPAHAPHATPAVDDEHSPPRPDRLPRTPRPARPVEPAPYVAPPPVEATPPPPVQPAVVERPVQARPVDPWQRMADSLSRCAGQDVFSRLGCEHRIRSSYCEGNWGRVPQCPAGISNDHGQ